MATGTRRLLTAEDLLLLRDDEHRTELIDGEVIRMAPAGGEHGEVTANAAWALKSHVKQHRSGRVFGAETGFVLRRNPDLVRAPDAAFIRRERIPATGIPKNFVPIVPDLIVEAVSPGDSASYVQRKIEDWLNAGVRLVWVVYSDLRRIAVHARGQPMRSLGEDESLDGGDVLPGFSVRVADILAEADGGGAA